MGLHSSHWQDSKGENGGYDWIFSGMSKTDLKEEKSSVLVSITIMFM